MTTTTETDSSPTLEVPVVSPVADHRGADADRPRPINTRSSEEVLSVVGALVGSFSLTWVAYFVLLPLSGPVGFVVCWYVVFLAMYAGVSSLDNPRPVVVSRLLAAALTLAALLVGAALVSIVVYTVVRGIPALTHFNFYNRSSSAAGPLVSLSKGGIYNCLQGTAMEVLIAVGISLPLGVTTAVFLSEVGGRAVGAIRTVIEAMTALPDLLAGLFVYVLLILYFHQPKDGLDAAIALATTMTSIVARGSLVALAVVPGSLREASLALGSTRWQMVRRVVLPTARPGLATALILAVARGVGETAPLLIVTGASGFSRLNPLHQVMNSLPLQIYEWVSSGQTKLIQRAFGGATVLLVLVLVLFVIARMAARQRTSR